MQFEIHSTLLACIPAYVLLRVFVFQFLAGRGKFCASDTWFWKTSYCSVITDENESIFLATHSKTLLYYFLAILSYNTIEIEKFFHHFISSDFYKLLS